MSARGWNWRAALLSCALFALFVGTWHITTLPGTSQQSVDAEYAKLVGAAAATGQKSAMPGPSDVGAKVWSHLADPLYDRGPNDKGG